MANRTFGSISLAGQSGGSGTLKITSAGFAWKARDGGRNITVAAADVSTLQWLHGGRGKQIRVQLKGGATLRFEGFRAADRGELRDFLHECFGKELSNVNQACRGWSWGELDVSQGGTASLVFRTGGGSSVKNKAGEFEDAFDIPLGSVANVQLPGGKELALDLHVDDTAAKQDEELVEIRFHVPDETEAEDIYERVKARADTSAFSGESICSFNQMGVLVPRGRFDVDLYPNYIKLRGKMVDFKILYTSVTRLFLLPKPDNMSVSFVMSLDPPIRQGNTMYPHLVFQFDTEERMSTALQLSDEDLKDKYKGKLAATEEGFAWRVFSRVVKILSSTPLHVPKKFKTSKDASAVRTAIGANDGFLFFLESCCFFVVKPPTYIRYDDIDFVEFRRMDLERRFDLFMSLATGSGQTLLFTNIERTEFEPIFKFLYDVKKVPVENAEQLRRTGGRQRVQLAEDDDDSESEDDDFDPNAMEGKSGGQSGGKGDSESDDDDEMDDYDSDGGGDSDLVEPDADELKALGAPAAARRPPAKKSKTKR